MSCSGAWTRASSEDRWVLQSAALALERARAICPLYAGAGAPLAEGQLVDLLRGAGAGVSYFRFRSTRVAFILQLAGAPEIALNCAAPLAVREWALRHELYHVLAEDVQDPAGGAVIFAEGGPDCAHERAADLFATLDLVPADRLAGLEDPGAAVRVAVEPLSSHYPRPERWIADRVALRLVAFREMGT